MKHPKKVRITVALSATVGTWAKQLRESGGYRDHSEYIENLIRREHFRETDLERKHPRLADRDAARFLEAAGRIACRQGRIVPFPKDRP